MENFKRKTIVITTPSEDGMITLLKPTSSEHHDKLFVVYEDAYGDYNFDILSYGEIAIKYYMDVKYLNKLIKRRFGND